MAIEARPASTAEIVYEIFEQTVRRYGRPSRVRGDRGSENLLVAADMNLSRGEARGSYIWGTSTHNTRIERLWVEVGKSFMRPWRAFFLRLERNYGLKANDSTHLWLLSEIFMPMIAEDCDRFKRQWNRHTIDNSAVNHMVPNVRLTSSFSFDS